MKSKSPLSLLKFIELTINARIAYNNAKEDPEVRKSITKFGTRALFYLSVFLLLCGGGIGIFVLSLGNFMSAGIFLSIIGIVSSVYMFIWGLPYFVLALNLTIKQLRLNKKFVGWLALSIIILIVLAFIVAIVVLLLKM
ncbi:MAG: hypothetical protein E7374_01940 [Clostridiales bacterium]|nr:hypothetical protein [Clostridiales bacterium]